MNENAMLTGKPSIDRPWMKFYPDVLRRTPPLNNRINKNCPRMCRFARYAGGNSLADKCE